MGGDPDHKEEGNEMGLEETASNNHKLKMKKKKKGISVSYILRRFGCIMIPTGDTAAIGVDLEADGGAKRDDGSLPTHLLVMVNGMIGSAKDWRYAAKQFLKAHPDQVLVHCSGANCSRLTLDGIDVMGNRLADEVGSVVREHPSLRKISFVSHSLGGLIARYAVALLYQPENVDESSTPKLGGNIAGLEPMNFITAATPHLGSRGHKQVPMFCGSYAVERAALRASGLFRRTGKHLFLCDGEGEPPLLVRMSRDCDDLKFISALQLFKNRMVYANIRYDHVVSWSSSSLRQRNELPKRRNLKRNAKYPPVVNEEHSSNTEGGPLEVQLPEDPISSMEEMMIRGLNGMSWRRVDISFKGAMQRLLAHTTIQVQNKRLDAPGADVIQHMIDNFEF